ncbi:MAG: polysaccharide deacetylase family protein [Lachnospiraceae bacterium]|nr:polysaccharide deacetylase family protein [Lachnospiraceae bacterium]
MSKKSVALTFDDGPNTTVTPLVLDLLEQYGIRASFFLIGENIRGEAVRVAERARDMGCDICNHSFTHPAMPNLSKEQMEEEIRKTDDRIREITGETTRFFRPPYIAVSDLVYDTVDKIFICGQGCEDWIPETSVQKRIDLTLGNMKDGMMVLLHDSAENYRTVEALKTIIPELLKQDYEFLTVSELFERRGVTPKPHEHVIYTVVGNTQGD